MHRADIPRRYREARLRSQRDGPGQANRVAPTDKSPSDTHLYPTREGLDGDSAVRVVREADPELGVELRLVCRIRVCQHVDDVAWASTSARA